MAYKYAALALASVSAVLADCNVSGTATIQNGGDATAFATCSTITGSIAIATSAAEQINIPNVRAITGDLTVLSAPNLTSFGADTLATVGGTLRVDDCQRLSSLTMPYISQVGNLRFNALPNLQALGFTAALRQAGQVNIQNTFLSSLNGINLQKVNTLYIANNPLLQDFSFQVDVISGSANVESNGDRLAVSFPNLLTAQNLTFRACPSISIPSLANVTGSLGFYESTFEMLTAPNLTSVAQTLAIVGNTKVTNISFPSLTTIGGGFQIQNNSLLVDLSNSFPKVATISGALDFNGGFNNVKLPGLKDVKGAFTLTSSADVNNDCNTFRAEAGSNKVIKGTLKCTANSNQIIGSNTTSSSSSTTSKSVAGGRLDVSSNAAIGIGSVLAAMFGLL